ncbi:hypothetical protein OsJ_34852 [Oryza sativa Japonica Group]|uniref:Uncharacterized protein n=1 Tax=Oryza sativa subsp. japonica TaxID=39947 RepID=A3CDZ6_ORYSJ|nr:hypothetical protein OsJ_34852 [Oryza sativa Japonica Group]
MPSAGPRHLPPPCSLATLTLPDAVELVCVLKQVEERRLPDTVELVSLSSHLNLTPKWHQSCWNCEEKALNNPEQVLRRMEQERRLVRMGTAGSVSIRVLTSGGGGEAVSFLFNGASMASSGAAVAGRTTLRACAPPWGKPTNAAAEGG